MKKKRIFILIVVLLIAFIGFSFNQFYKSYQQALTDDFYNKSLLLSVKVFIRVNSLPGWEDMEKVNLFKDEVDAYYYEFKQLKTTKDTIEGEQQMQKLFDTSYEMFDLVEKFHNKDPEANSFTNLEKLSEVQTHYFMFSSMVDLKKIPLTSETIEQVQHITIEFMNNHY